MDKQPLTKEQMEKARRALEAFDGFFNIVKVEKKKTGNKKK